MSKPELYPAESLAGITTHLGCVDKGESGAQNDFGFASVGPTNAQVAELADALDSGSSDRKVVEVRILSWAPLT